MGGGVPKIRATDFVTGKDSVGGGVPIIRATDFITGKDSVGGGAPKIRATDFDTGKGHNPAIERLAFSPDIAHKGNACAANIYNHARLPRDGSVNKGKAAQARGTRAGQ